MPPATKPKLTRTSLQRHQQRILHLETRRHHAGITHLAPPSSTKKSSGFSLIVTPSLHVSEVKLPLNTHSIRNRFPRPLNTTRYPPFLHRTTLPANTADLISSKLTAFLSVSSTAPCGDDQNLPHHPPSRQAGICRTMRKSLDAIPTNVYGPPQRNPADRTTICPIFQTPQSQIPDPESRISVWRMAQG